MGMFRIAVEMSAVIGALFFTAKLIYHTYFVVTNVTGKYASLLGPLVLFIPGQLNASGNKHRAAMARAFLGVVSFWGLLFASGALNYG